LVVVLANNVTDFNNDRLKEQDSPIRQLEFAPIFFGPYYIYSFRWPLNRKGLRRWNDLTELPLFGHINL